MVKIAIIIVNWNGVKDTLECLQSITDLNVNGLVVDIIVVDNASTDNTVNIIRENFPKTIIIENSENLGFAEGNNTAIRKGKLSNYDYFFLVNNDTILEKNCIINLIKSMENEKETGIMSPKIYFAKNFEYHKERYQENERGKVIWYAGGIIDWNNIICSHRGVDDVDMGQYEKEIETDFVSGCGMLIKKEVIDDIGLFDKKYFMYLEDVDFCVRAKNKGWKLKYNPNGIMWHKNASSSGKPGSKLHEYYQIRNRFIFGFKYASLRTKIALIRESFRFLLQNSVKSKAVMDFYLRRFDKGTYNGTN
jgi:GT2 family glycosyltransferase